MAIFHTNVSLSEGIIQYPPVCDSTVGWREKNKTCKQTHPTGKKNYGLLLPLPNLIRRLSCSSVWNSAGLSTPTGLVFFLRIMLRCTIWVHEWLGYEFPTLSRQCIPLNMFVTAPWLQTGVPVARSFTLLQNSRFAPSKLHLLHPNPGVKTLPLAKTVPNFDPTESAHLLFQVLQNLHRIIIPNFLQQVLAPRNELIIPREQLRQHSGSLQRKNCMTIEGWNS